MRKTLSIFALAFASFSANADICQSVRELAKSTMMAVQIGVPVSTLEDKAKQSKGKDTENLGLIIIGDAASRPLGDTTEDKAVIVVDFADEYYELCTKIIDK